MLHDGKKCSGPSQTIVEVKLKRKNGATGATSLKAGCVFTTNKYGSTTAATEVDIVKTEQNDDAVVLCTGVTS